MKVSASVKKMCRNCKVIRRKGVVRVILLKLQHKGLVKRCGWRENPTGRLPAALYQAVSAKEFVEHWSHLTAA